MTDQQGMRGYRQPLESVHAVGAAVWFGAVAMSAVTASVAFGTLPDLDPTLGAYPLFTGDHGRLTAGHVAGQVFLIADVAQFVAATLVMLTTIGLVSTGGLSLRRLSSGVRMIAMGLAIGLLAYHLLILGAELNSDLRGLREAATAGDEEAAAAFREAFQANHGKARTILGGIGISTFVLIMASAWSAATPAKADPVPVVGRKPSSAGKTRLEQPKLATPGKGIRS